MSRLALVSLLPLLSASLLALVGCTSPGAEPTEVAGRPGAGSVRERLQPQVRAPESDAREVEPEGDAREPGGFDFGHGPVAKRRPRDAAEAPESVPTADQGIRVTWEALAVEREQVENPHFGRRPLRGVTPNLRIVLVSQDHPAAAGRDKGRTATPEKDGSQVAVLASNDMQMLVRGLREAGFYKVARSTGALQPQFDDESARGRVTIEVKGESMTVLSMRGQGTSPTTKDIPRVYSEAKQAVAMLRNATPTLNVLTAGKEPIRPTVSARRGQGRVLTPEEAAAILGESAPAPGGKPAGPADDGWLGR